MLASQRALSACYVYSWSFKKEAPDRRLFLSFQEQILTLSDAGNVVWLEKDLISFSFSLVSKRKLLPPALAEHGWFRLCLVGWGRWGASELLAVRHPPRPSGLTLEPERAGGEFREGLGIRRPTHSASNAPCKCSSSPYICVCLKFFIIGS